MLHRGERFGLLEEVLDGFLLILESALGENAFDRNVTIETPIEGSPWVAATRRLGAMPTLDATFPQSMLPPAMAPKNTVRKKDNPRARTQSGRAVWAETWKLASTAIHDTPASADAATATAST